MVIYLKCHLLGEYVGKPHKMAALLLWQSLWRRKWQPALVFLPGKSHGQRSLAGSLCNQSIFIPPLNPFVHPVKFLFSIYI